MAARYGETCEVTWRRKRLIERTFDWPQANGRSSALSFSVELGLRHSEIEIGSMHVLAYSRESVSH